MCWRPGGTRSAIACDPANLDSVIETTRPLCRLDQCLKADQPGAGTTATKRLQGARWCRVEPHFRINHVGHGAPINSAIDCFYKCHFLLAVKALVRCSSAFDHIPNVSKTSCFHRRQSAAPPPILEMYAGGAPFPQPGDRYRYPRPVS
jgi:hypothetical protein